MTQTTINLPDHLASITSQTTLIDYLDQGHAVKYLMFWGHTPRSEGNIDKSCLSQWFDAGFNLDDRNYRTAEHYMMAQKALLFDDRAAYDRILAAQHPNEAKQIGREVKGFEANHWQAHCFGIVVDGNVAKFDQNPELKAFLLSTIDRVLVEASPVDRIWGIGLAARDRAAEQPRSWQGTNLLGFALMQARSQLYSADLKNSVAM